MWRWRSIRLCPACAATRKWRSICCGTRAPIGLCGPPPSLCSTKLYSQAPRTPGLCPRRDTPVHDWWSSSFPIRCDGALRMPNRPARDAKSCAASLVRGTESAERAVGMEARLGGSSQRSSVPAADGHRPTAFRARANCGLAARSWGSVYRLASSTLRRSLSLSSRSWPSSSTLSAPPTWRAMDAEWLTATLRKSS
jgi:hypothetical protein